MMKKMMKLLPLFLFLFCQAAISQKIIPSGNPNETQQKMMERGYGMFIHFGVNTFGESTYFL